MSVYILVVPIKPSIGFTSFTQVLRRAQLALKLPDEEGADVKPGVKARAKAKGKAKAKAKANAKTKSEPKRKTRKGHDKEKTQETDGTTEKSDNGDAEMNEATTAVENETDKILGDSSPCDPSSEKTDNVEKSGKVETETKDKPETSETTAEKPKRKPRQPRQPKEPSAGSCVEKKTAKKRSASKEPGNEKAEEKKKKSKVDAVTADGSKKEGAKSKPAKMSPADSGEKVSKKQKVEPATFARRAQPSSKLGKAKWIAMRKEFNTTIRPRLLKQASIHEDSCFSVLCFSLLSRLFGS